MSPEGKGAGQSDGHRWHFDARHRDIGGRPFCRRLDQSPIAEDQKAADGEADGPLGRVAQVAFPSEKNDPGRDREDQNPYHQYHQDLGEMGKTSNTQRTKQKEDKTCSNEGFGVGFSGHGTAREMLREEFWGFDIITKYEETYLQQLPHSWGRR